MLIDPTSALPTSLVQNGMIGLSDTPRPTQTMPAFVTFQLGQQAACPCHSCLAEWAPGSQAMLWHSVARKPGMLERAAKRGHNGLAVEPLSG